MTTIYSYKSKDSKDKICDTGAVLQYALGIDWYPSFLIIDETDYKFVGQVEDDMLEEYLLNAIN